MALKPDTNFAGKINPATSAYPYGSARNVTTQDDGTGTPFIDLLINDNFGWQQALLDEAGIVPSGSPDSKTTSQYLDAWKSLFYENSKIADRVALSGNAVFTDTTQFATGTTLDGQLTLDTIYYLRDNGIKFKTQGFYTGSTRGNADYIALDNADMIAGGYAVGYSAFEFGSSGVFACLVIDEYPVASQIGIGIFLSDNLNSLAINSAVSSFGGVIIDVDFSFSEQILLPEAGVTFKSTESEKNFTMTWVGADSVWALSPSSSNGAYNVKIKNLTLRGASTKKLFDGARVRFSYFENFNCLGGLIPMRIRSSWNTMWINCAFRTENLNVTGSKALYFEYDINETFNVVNTAVFVGCYFSASESGVVIETGGDGIHFSNCRIEGNKSGIVFQGDGGSHGIIFNNGCYIEGNTIANIRWNKIGAGNFWGVVFSDNYFGTNSTSRSGIIEFVASNGGGHSIKFENNTLRDFDGLPSQNVLLDVNGATMSNIFIDWKNNGKGVSIPSFNKDSVDWRYIKSDVVVKLAYITNTTSGNDWTAAYSNAEIFARSVEYGVVDIWGTFTDPTNAFSGALNITEALPVTMRPSGLEKFFGATITDASAESVSKTVMLNAGQIRSINIGADKVSFNHRYSLNVVKTTTVI